MNAWLFDLGNTRLKCAPLHADGGIGEVLAQVHDDAGAWLDSLPAGTVACIASVAPEARRVALLGALCGRFRRLHLVQSEARLGRLRIAYRDPAQLGVDRFLGMLGIREGGAALVVGIGTALTIDLVDAGGLHRGGRIAPSPALMRDALHARVAQLPRVGGRYTEFADGTDHALASGCEGMALALVERSMQAARALLGEVPVLHLHGGGAVALRAGLPAHAWTPDLVLRGLARWHALRIA